MAAGGEKSSDFYAVLGLRKECSPSELRDAYKKLALRWHPDRCSASGNPKFVEEAKKKFQVIQAAYSVLSDANKRFMYDVGAYDSDDDENGMSDFLGEMATMMSQTKPSENEEESFEELQELFEEMFQRDINCFGSTSQSSNVHFPPSASIGGSDSSSNNKRNCSDMNSGKGKGGDVLSSDFSAFSASHDFCLGANDGEDSRGRSSGKRRNGRKQKVSSGHDVSSRNAKISA